MWVGAGHADLLSLHPRRPRRCSVVRELVRNGIYTSQTAPSSSYKPTLTIMAALAPIPIYTSLSELYDNLGTAVSHAPRWNNLIAEFEKRFGGKPKYIARAPGRVKWVISAIGVDLMSYTRIPV